MFFKKCFVLLALLTKKSLDNPPFLMRRGFSILFVCLMGNLIGFNFYSAVIKLPFNESVVILNQFVISLKLEC